MDSPLRAKRVSRRDGRDARAAIDAGLTGCWGGIAVDGARARPPAAPRRRQRIPPRSHTPPAKAQTSTPLGHSPSKASSPTPSPARPDSSRAPASSPHAQTLPPPNPLPHASRLALFMLAAGNLDAGQGVCTAGSSRSGCNKSYALSGTGAAGAARSGPSKMRSMEPALHTGLGPRVRRHQRDPRVRS